MAKKLRDYAHELEDFGQAQDFVLNGVWEALDYGPTFVLSDGGRLRPLTATREPEPTWRITSP